MKMTFSSWCLWLVLVGCASGSHAAILYVDKDNSCPGSGTTGSPYCSIQNAFDVVNPGDTIRIRDSATPYDGDFNLTRSGTNGNPITIEPDTGHHPILRYSAGAAVQNAPIDMNNVTDIIVQNLDFDGSGVQTSAFAVRVQGGSSTRVHILNNTFQNWGGNATQGALDTPKDVITIDGGFNGGCSSTGQPTGVRIAGNTFTNNRSRNIQVTHANDTLIENNTFTGVKCSLASDVNTVGIHIHDGCTPGNNLSHGTIIRNNTFHDFIAEASCDVSGGTFPLHAAIWCDGGHGFGEVSGNQIYNINQGDDATLSYGTFIEDTCWGWAVQNNVIYDIGRTGIRQRHYNFGTNPSTWDTNAGKYYNNTVFRVGQNGIEVDTGRTIVENNVVMDAGNVQIWYRTADAGIHTINYNDYFSTTGGTHYGNWGASNVSFANWKSACSCDANSLGSNPTFVSTASTPDLALQSSSPAKDVGLDLTSAGVTTDVEGTTRPQGSAFDMGAYEFVTVGAAPDIIGVLR